MGSNESFQAEEIGDPNSGCFQVTSDGVRLSNNLIQRLAYSCEKGPQAYENRTEFILYPDHCTNEKRTKKNNS